MYARNIVEKVKDTNALKRSGQLKVFDLSGNFRVPTRPVKQSRLEAANEKRI